MKVLLVSEFFYPYNTGTQKILTELAEDFIENSLEVDVLTTKNAYREKKQNLNKYEIYKGINIKRVFSSNFNRDNKLGRLSNYLIFTNSIFLNLLFKNDYDKILFVSNPPLIPYVGYLINKIKKKNYIYLVHDVYPDIAEQLGVISKKSIISKVMNYMNNKIYEGAEKIVVLGTDMERVIINKGVEKSKINIVTNWADSKKIYPINKENEFAKNNKLKDTFNIMYTGNIGRFHDVETIIECAKKLKEFKDIKFIFVGEGYKKELIKQQKEKNKLDNIILLGYQDDSVYNEVLNSADIFVASLEEGVEGLAVPSKTYSYLAAGKPIVGIMSNLSEIGSNIEKYDLGLRIESGNVKELEKFIVNMKNNKILYKNIEKNAKELFVKNYDRKIVTKQFSDVIIST